MSFSASSTWAAASSHINGEEAYSHCLNTSLVIFPSLYWFPQSFPVSSLSLMSLIRFILIICRLHSVRVLLFALRWWEETSTHKKTPLTLFSSFRIFICCDQTTQIQPDRFWSNIWNDEQAIQHDPTEEQRGVECLASQNCLRFFS